MYCVEKIKISGEVSREAVESPARCLIGGAKFESSSWGWNTEY